MSILLIGAMLSTGSSSVFAEDLEPPSIPQDVFAITVSSSQINLSWQPSTDNISVAGYRIYRNGRMIDKTEETYYFDDSLLEGTEYKYTVSAFDSANNESIFSLEVALPTGMSTGSVYYVSPTAISTNWQAAKDKENPCTPKTAMKNIKAGETVYFLEGKYNIPELGPLTMWSYHSFLEVENSGTVNNPIVFAAYPQAVVIMNGLGDQSDEVRVFSTGMQDYIIFDGFVIQANDGAKMGSMIIGYDIGDWNKVSQGCIVRNCFFNGGFNIIKSSDNRECLRIEWTMDTLVQNCKIYNCWHQTNNHNTSGIKMYHNKNTIIEQCEIYYCSTGIFDKSDGRSSVYRYNFFHDCRVGLEITSYFDDNHSHDDSKIYHNLFVNNKYSSITEITEENSHSHNQEIYNNTFYGSHDHKVSISLGGGINKKFYNNIIYGYPIDGDIGLLRWRGTGTVLPEIAECDHNQFGDLPNFLIKKNSTSWTTLDSWKNSNALMGGKNPGEGSLRSNPRFENGSGKLTEINDFVLANDSPCKEAGRNGVNMGADVSKVGTQGYINERMPSSPNYLDIK